MSTRQTRRDRGQAKGRAVNRKFADEIRSARLNIGKSQLRAAKGAGISRATWGRIERGQRPVDRFGLAAVMAAVVGLDLSVQLYPSDTLPRDVAHIRLLGDARQLIGDGWQWRYEVPVGAAPDQRAWDAEGVHDATQVSFKVEAEVVVRDCQLLRRVEAKRQASGEPRVILAVRDSKANRLAVATAREILAAAFPVASREALRGLRAGQDPGGDVLLLVDWRKVETDDADGD